MTIPAVLIGGQAAGWLAGRVRQDALRRFLAAFLIGLALLTGFRAAVGDGLPPAGWVLLATLLLVLGIGASMIWNRRRQRIRCCYTSCDYYCPPRDRSG
jgi:uncharacterized membrane protein YeiB